MHKSTFYFTLLILVFFSFVPLYGQWDDDFSINTIDGSEWSGDLSDFIITDENVLRLMADEGGSSTLFHTVSFFDENEWSFKMKMDFAPSNSNKTRYYLMANVVGGIVVEGIYLEIGESGSEDAIHLYKFQDNMAVLLLSGTIGAVASQPVNVDIKVQRRVGDLWRLSVAYDAPGNYIFEAEIVDSFYPINSANGVMLVLDYTSTRTDKFYFDDFVSKVYSADVTGPQIVDHTIVSDTKIQILFDEPVDISGLGLDQFNLLTIGNPINYNVISPTVLEIEFANAFPSGQELTLELSNISDLEGNITALSSFSFSYSPVVHALEFDILINEIMADPTPSITLPECEYIELYNSSSFTFNLLNYTIESGGTPQNLPSFELEAGGYVIITDIDCQDQFDDDIDVIYLNSFPALSNAGDYIGLKNNLGENIHNVTYSIAWYGDPSKDDGGYSLELINPNKPCALFGNWTVTSSIFGGTPGEENAVLDDEEDNEGPELLAIFPLNDFELELTFSEVLTASSVGNVSFYAIDGLDILAANLLIPQTHKVSILLADPIVAGSIYTLEISGGLEDCIGNEISLATKDFGLAIPPQEGDCLINELLFNPYTGGSEFVELFNDSENIINLNDLLLVSNSNTVYTLPEYILLPQAYAALSTNAFSLVNNYLIENPDALVNSALPSFLNSEGRIVIYSKIDPAITIDSFYYKENMHLDFIHDKKGISLERSSFVLNTNDPNNWHSASKDSGFATPGYENSQFIGEVDVSAQEFTLRYDAFSPNQDGYRDYLIIDYKLPDTDNLISMSIYNSDGYLIKDLDESISLSQEGFLTWDGLDDDNLFFPAGIYILTISGVSLSSDKTYHVKLPFVLALPVK